MENTTVSFEKIQSLLKAKDDTSRFVGLALLKAVLDDGRLVQDSAALHTLWECISPKFLDRLLRAGQNDKISHSEANDMVDLAVAVLHTFTILLPEDVRKDSRLAKRAAPLVNALLYRLAYITVSTPSSGISLTNFFPVLLKLPRSYCRRWCPSSVSRKVQWSISSLRISPR